MQKKTTFVMILVVAIIALLGGLGYLVVQDRFGGTTYYTHTKGEGRKIVSTTNGEKFVEYEYTFHGYDKDGNRKEYSLMKVGSPMTQDRYIAVVHNSNRGVVSWQEVQKSDVPLPAMDKLNADARR